MTLAWLLISLIAVQAEEVFFNGTHRIANQTKAHVEVTTVKIAEIANIKSNSTVVLKAKTAIHYAKPTVPSTKLILIPPAKIGAQIA